MTTFLQFLAVFACGGALCAAAQILIDKTRLTPARILVAYVVAGVVLGAVGIYKPFVDFAGAGATTPIIGFGYLISSGVKSAVAERGLLGALSGPLEASAVGVSASLVFSLLAAVVFRSRPKR